jgi:NADPH-dependent curcumin reductase CurA
MTETFRGREVHLASRPVGEPTAENFAVLERDIPAPAEGEVVVRNAWMSVDPYMRGRMNDARSYVPPFQLGEVMGGAAVGEVVASNAAEMPVGEQVYSELGWREYALASASAFRKIDTTAVPATAYVSVLGLTGLTAYAGLFDVAGMKPGDAVFVSGAAGSVGGLAGQFARLKGASRVVGSAGSDAKVRHVIDELGFDDAFNYRDGKIRESLRRVAPDGIDVYFDNVGGEILDAALTRLARHARIVICGAVSQYNATEAVRGPSNYLALLVSRATMTGMVVFDYAARYGEAMGELAQWMREGKIVSREHIVEGGVSAFPDSLLKLFAGENIGKLVLSVGG